MTDDGNMMECESVLYHLRMIMYELAALHLEPRHLQELERCLVTGHNVLRKHRSNHATR